MSAGECDEEEFYDAEDFLTTEEEEEASSSSGREADSSPTPRFATQPTTAAVAAASSGGEDAERTESPGKLFSRSAPALPQRLCLITDLDSGRTYPLPAVDAATGTLPVVSAPRIEVHHLQSVSTAAATPPPPPPHQQQSQSRVAGFFGRLTHRRKGAAALGFAQSRVVQQLQQSAADAEGGDGPRRSCGHPVWVLQWSRCRTMLAAAGHDHAVTVWRRSSGPDAGSVFDPAPCAVLRGHADDVFAIDWVAAPSQNDAASSAAAAAALPRVVSGGMDRTARVWELSASASSGGRLLATFAHPDVVTSVACDPENSDNVLTGSLDNIVRLWSIRDPKQPSKYINIGEFVTAVAFVGSALAVVGTTDGNCVFLNTHDFTIERRLTLLSFHGRRSREGRRKVTGFSVRPHAGEAAAVDTQLLVTSSDSRARLYSLRDLRLIGKFKGFASTNLCQIHASFSDGGAFAICGSEAKCACFWRALSNPSGTQQQQQAPPRASVPAELFSASRRDVTATAFVPRIHDSEFPEGSLFVAADIAGSISVFENPVLSHC